MTIKDFYRIYSPKRIWRKFWLGLSCFPMLPQHRAKCLKMGGVNIKGRALIYNGVGVDSVAPDKIYIGNHVAITAGVKILTHTLILKKREINFALERCTLRMMCSLALMLLSVML